MKRQGTALRSGPRQAGRDTADFDLGVKHRIAAAKACQLLGASKTARAIAEVVRTGVSSRGRQEATLLAACGLLERGHGRRMV